MYCRISVSVERQPRWRSSEVGVAENTLLWFCSDNGPEGKKGKAPGAAGTLRGRKRDLLEGGIRVPGLLEWPARIKEGRRTAIPAGTIDYLPTIVDVERNGAEPAPRHRPLGRRWTRPRPN